MRRNNQERARNVFSDYPEEQRKKRSLQAGEYLIVEPTVFIWKIGILQCLQFAGQYLTQPCILSLNRLMICQAGITVYAPKAIDIELTIKIPTLIELWPI